jgi:hypothetical protein
MGKGALSGTSISLPKMGAAGKLSISPLKSGAGRFGAGTVMMDVPMEMVGKDREERTGRAECVRSLFVVSFFVN